ncbi:MAG: nucleotidyl transferase AbiEii/AbiGii toxin family protein [archaeon]
MITKQELSDLCRITHFKPYQQEKHYMQTVILNSIYSTITNELIFKGGTCLLFFYGLNRFSEDLDFTLIKEIDTERLVSNIKKDLETLGIPNKISEIEETNLSISFKIGAEGPLFNKEIERCFVKIDVSKREEVLKYEIIETRTNYKEILGFSIPVMAKEEIFAEKIRAIMTRNQARDLYDLDFLIKLGVKPNLELVNKKLSFYKKEFNKEEFEKAILIKENIWISELTPFILGKFSTFKEVKDSVFKSLKDLI